MNPILKTIHVSLVCSVLLLAAPARSQITPDTTLGNEASRLTPNQIINNASADRIDGGAVRGSNLFHSFSQFNIDDGQRAYFSNPVGVQNILTRVTGTSASNILGTLGVDGAANLFLINPNGILFGQNASLDVRGSFVGTTANGVKFGSQGVFDASDKQAPALLTINPSALLFNQINSGAITTNQTILPMRPGKNLALVGGNIQFNEGALVTQNGRIEITAVGSVKSENNVDSKTIELNTDGSLNASANILTGNISLIGAQVYVFAGDGGSITMNAGNFDISGNSYITSGIGDGQPRASQTGDITLNATDSISIREGSRIENSVFENHSGSSSDIKITTGSLLLTDNARLRANVFGQGNAGNIIINAREQVSLDKNAAIFANVRETGKGNGGNIIINANSFSATNDAELSASTYGKGNTGDILLSARNISLSNNASVLNRVQQTGIGLGGNIRINTETLSFTNEASIQTFSFGLGSPGDVIIDASNQLSLDTNASISTLVTDDSGGSIRIETGLLSVVDSEISTYTFGKGKAGDITIGASKRADINGKNSDIISQASTEASGSTGNIIISTPSLFINQDASINNLAVDSSAGNIQIDTGLLSVTNGSNISTYTFGKGEAGNIEIGANNSININGKNSQIIAQVSASASGNGGNIVIFTPSLFIDQEGRLVAISFGQGNTGNIIINADRQVFLDNRGGIFNNVQGDSIQGGDIRINTETLKASNLARVQAGTSGKGLAGNVIINSHFLELVGSRDDGQERTTIGSLTGEEATGNGGNVEILTNTLTLKDGAIVSTLVSGKKSNAGTVKINAHDGIFLDYGLIFSRVNKDAVGNGGDISITTGILELTNSSQIDASTFGDGDAGNINIIAKQPIAVVGIGENQRSSAIFSTTGDNPAIAGTGPIVVGKGKGGNITIKTPLLTVRDGGVIDARTFNDKPGGNINLTLDSLQLLNGGQIFTTSQSGGSAGTITIDAKNQVDIAGSDPTYSNRLSQFPRRVVQISPNSGLYVRATEAGTAGNINLTTARLNLSDKGTINAESNTVDGGDINLNVNNVLVMRKESTISATAGLAQGVGNGGNINIKAGAIIAVPRENSDIRANAFEGRGGNVTINTDGLFGIAASRVDTFESNITASSELGVQGQIAIAQPDVDPTQGILELPTQVVDVSNQIGQLCPRGELAFRRPLNQFIVTGRGSLPPNPLQPMPGRLSNRQLATLESNIQSQQALQRIDGNIEAKPASTIVEAQGWIKNADGTIALVAVPTATPSNRPSVPTCPVSS